MTFSRRLRRTGRLATSRFRSEPDFLIIGAQKAGTTSLYRYLSAHPGVLPSSTKEVHYFDHQFHRGPGWYRSHFPVSIRKKRVASGLGHPVLTGEATPYYLAHPLAASRAHAAVPQARVVVLVREPAQRAYSHWRMERALGREPLSFEEALAAEDERLDGEDERLTAGIERSEAPHQTWSYVARGRYAQQLSVWRTHFSTSQMLVVQAERLFDQPGAAYADVLQHLGLPSPDRIPDFVVHGGGGGGGNAQMADQAADGLRERLAVDNQALFEMTGIDYR